MLVRKIDEDDIVAITTSAKRQDLKGMKFGHLTALEYIGNYEGARGRQHAIWKCRCDCGNVVNVKSKNLQERRTTHCGCLRLKEKILKLKFSQKVCESLIELGYSSCVTAARDDGRFDDMRSNEEARESVALYAAESGHIALGGELFCYICDLLGIDKDEYLMGDDSCAGK